jgi:hypothetical protein
VDNTKEYIEDSLPSLLTKDPLEACMTHFGFGDFGTDQYIDEVHDLLETAASAGFHP